MISLPNPTKIFHTEKNDMTTFTDYVAQQDARNTIQLNVTKYALMLCDALQQSHQRSHPNGRNYSYALSD
jgi:hypothetical protein